MVTGLGIVCLSICLVALSTQTWGFSISTSTRSTAVVTRGSFIQPIAENGIYNGHGQHSNSLCLLFSTASSTDGEQVGPPTYVEEERAVDYFSKLYFYKNERLANFCSDDREEVFGIMLMRDVIKRWSTDEQQEQLAVSIGAWPKKVILALTPVEVEDKLNDKIVAINGQGEITILDKYHVAGVPSATKAVKSVNTKLPLNRERQLYAITGPSGAGKTFFAAKEIATDGVLHAKQVTLYVQPNKISSYNAITESSGADWESRKQGMLMKFIEDRLTAEVGYDPKEKLKMHVTVVLDEILRRDYFDNETQPLITFYDTHMVKFADSVRLIACGTGLTGENLATDVDCYKIHLKKWSRDDVAVVLAERLMPNNKLDKIDFDPAEAPTPNKTFGKILNAIVNQPVLNALTTNARSAGFLLEEVVTFSKNFAGKSMSQDKISNRLNAAAPSLFDTVVFRYTKMNGIQSLNEEECRRVAAFVLGAVEDASNKTRLEPPDLIGLSDKEESVAWSLLDHNLEYSSLKGKKPRLVRENGRSVSVSPAITVVLFTMLNTPATIFTSWSAQERISALYACRQEVLLSLRRFQSNRGNGLTGLDHDLAKLDLVLLRERVPRSGKLKSFIVPRFAKNTIWTNGAQASFADVIAPYRLIQCKHTSVDDDKARVVVDLNEELGKCGLLRNSDSAVNDKDTPGRVALRAIWFMWSDDYEDHHNLDLDYNGTNKVHRVVSAEEQEDSLAFPENVLDSPNLSDQFESVEVLLDNGNWWIVDGTQRVEVPELSCLFKPGKQRVSFVISTNSPRIAVFDSGRDKDSGKGQTICKVWKNCLHDDGRVNVDLLTTREEKDAWEKFEATIVDGVDVKFLFT